MSTRAQQIPTPALVLGLGGLLPFALGAVLAWFPQMLPAFDAMLGQTTGKRPDATIVLGAYGAVILSFLGGVRWGQLLEHDDLLCRWQPLTLSVLPSLIAWPALLLPAVPMLLLLLGGFLLQYQLDAKGVASGQLPGWFGKLRLMLSIGAGICLVVGLMAVIS